MANVVGESGQVGAMLLSTKDGDTMSDANAESMRPLKPGVPLEGSWGVDSAARFSPAAFGNPDGSIEARARRYVDTDDNCCERCGIVFQGERESRRDANVPIDHGFALDW